MIWRLGNSVRWRFAAVENLSDSEDTKYTKENIKTSAKGSRYAHI